VNEVPTKSAFQNPNRVVSASRERPIFGEYFCVRAVYSSALDAYSKVLKRALRANSPDGKKVAYSGLAGLDRNGAESDIYTINAGGGGKTQVTSTDNAQEFHPSWGRRP
jgi:hypothetical protein